MTASKYRNKQRREKQAGNSGEKQAGNSGEKQAGNSGEKQAGNSGEKQAGKSGEEKQAKIRMHGISGRQILTAVILILDLAIILIFSTGFYNMHRKLDQLTYELSYLSDNNQVLINSVDDMKADIESTLQEEASFLESWNIQLKNMDFADNTYTVSIQVVPKEYTENTRATIYFGTKEFPLTLNGYCFVGEAELTLEEAYDGNVTVLFVDGSSRKTEVLADYSDVRTDLTNVLYGQLFEDPEYQDGQLVLKGTGYVELDGGDFFVFDNLYLIVEADGEEAAVYDLAAMAGGVDKAAAGEEEAAAAADAPEDISLEEIQANLLGSVSDNSDETAGAGSLENSTEMTGTSRNRTVMPAAWLSYTYTLEGDAVAIMPGSQVRIYLKAITENDFVFTYDLYHCGISEENESDPAGETDIDLTGYAAVYDSEGGCYKIR